MRRVTVTVCDICGNQRQTRRWRISGGGGGKAIDLCAECSNPLVRLLAAAEGHDLFTPVDDDTIRAARRRKPD